MASPPPPEPPMPPQRPPLPPALRQNAVDPLAAATSIMGSLLFCAVVALIAAALVRRYRAAQEEVRKRQAELASEGRTLPLPATAFGSPLRDVEAGGQSHPSLASDQLQKAQFEAAAQLIDEADFQRGRLARLSEAAEKLLDESEFNPADDDNDEDGHDEALAQPDDAAIAMEAAALQHSRQWKMRAEEEALADGFEWPEGVQEWPPSPHDDPSASKPPSTPGAITAGAPPPATPSLFFWPTPCRSSMYPATPAEPKQSSVTASAAAPATAAVAASLHEAADHSLTTPRPRGSEHDGRSDADVEASDQSPGSVMLAELGGNNSTLLKDIRAEACATHSTRDVATREVVTPAAVRAARAVPLPSSPSVTDPSGSVRAEGDEESACGGDEGGNGMQHGGVRSCGLTTPKKTSACATYCGRQKKKPSRRGAAGSFSSAQSSWRSQMSSLSQKSASSGRSRSGEAASGSPSTALPTPQGTPQLELAPQQEREQLEPNGAVGPTSAPPFAADLEAVQQQAQSPAEKEPTASARARQKPKPSKSARGGGGRSQRQAQLQLTHEPLVANERELDC